MQTEIQGQREFAQAVEFLPDVFSVQVTDQAVSAFAAPGDVLTLQKSKVSDLCAGDGILVTTSANDALIRRYQPLDDGGFMAESTSPEFSPLNSNEVDMKIVAVVIGIPSTRWSTLAHDAP